MRKLIITLALVFSMTAAAGAVGGHGWWVVTFAGDLVAGPFDQLTTCQDIAREYARHYYNVSRVCQYR